jgi:hypothetical protein
MFAGNRWLLVSSKHKKPFSPMDIRGGKHDQPVGGPNMAPENWHRFGEATLYKQQQKMFQLWLGSDIPAWNSWNR